MSKLFNKFKKYKITILALVLAIFLLYIIHFYMEHSILKFIVWVLVIIIEVTLIQYEKKIK
ncbi:hypothetical protein CSBG_03509 [Clostridium sp. 7_2_43FAA]|jgi:uncharacterized membrane protein YoaK (UPF0700 family)|uniref:hypothetical protein n=1 Tax=Clostridium tertium TaxID=1559 RepID=UPI000289A73C|nr:hypothetical protein CSBG_03509 [Clostridium sp. 7_2_43FAA]MDU3350333.1 hypothetical protein [Clostridium sp.]MDU8964860.1 hypothetical protein [Clostridium sp.]